ncbi:bifunctional 2-polyprenyl-6-hydroxyphenol methylase/3-demethylubiquinol 3-O-methyltransferase UbiG [Arthrobacter alpinus]|uniref:class I SAM-dependent methyltransferase n=1 Tax=Arthrobacter alpinus TaxID=656366 RepID=UPI000A8929EA|nr:methyltransferase domain-containing protein [Arthrobacter alpinus]
MSPGRGYDKYAAKMRHHAHAGTYMEVDVRFIDMMFRRRAKVLDIGRGIGNAVNGLRARGHAAYGVDPTLEVLEVAGDLYEPSWFRQMAATEATPERLAMKGLPQGYDVVLMSGNDPAFLFANDLHTTINQVGKLLEAGGVFIVGTTTAIQGGPVDQDKAVAGSAMTLTHRFSDWHLSPFHA